MNLLFSGVSILAILASLNISDLQAGKNRKNHKDTEKTLSTTQKPITPHKNESPKYEDVEISIALTTIELPPLTKERDQQFREDFKQNISAYVELLKDKNSKHEDLVSAIIELYQKNYHLNYIARVHFNRAIGPIDTRTGKRIDFELDDQEQEDLKHDSIATLRLNRDDKTTTLKLPLNKLGSQYLRAILKRMIRDFSIFSFQDSIIKDITFKVDDRIPFQQLDKIRLSSKYNPLCVLYDLSGQIVHSELQRLIQLVRENQSTVTTPMEFYTEDRNFEIEKFFLVQNEKWTHSELLLNFLEEKARKWISIFRQYDMDSILKNKIILVGFEFQSTVKNVKDLFESAITNPFHKKRDELQLDPSMHTLEEYFNALIRKNYRKATFYHSISKTIETFVNEQLTEDGVDLRYPSSVVLRMGAPGHYFDRPLINPEDYDIDIETVEDQLKVFVSDFQFTVNNRGENASNVRKFLELFYESELFSQVPFFKFSGPMTGNGSRSHFSDGLLKFAADGTPSCTFPEQVIVYRYDQENGGKVRTEKSWQEITQEELRGSFPYFYTRLLIVNLRKIICRPTGFDDLPLDQVILDTFGEKNKAYYDSLTEEEKQLLLMECGFYMMDKCQRLLLDLESDFFNRIGFIPERVKDNKNFTHTISPLANDLRENPMALVYEVMKGRVMTSELTPTDLKRNWVNLYSNAANFIAPIVKSSQGSTFFRMAYKYILAAHQIEEYLSALNRISDLKIYQEKVENISAEIENIKKELAETLIKDKANKAELQKLKKENKGISETLDAAIRDSEKKKDQLQKSVERERSLQKDLKAVKLDHTQLTEKLEITTQELEISKRKLTETQQFQAQVQTLEKALRQASAEKEKLEMQMSSLETQLKVQTTSLEQAEEKRTADLTLKQEEIENLQKELATVQKSAEDQITQLTKEKEELQTALDHMKTEVAKPAGAPEPQLSGVGYHPSDLISWIVSAKTSEEATYWSHVLYQTGRRDILSQLRNGLLIPMDQIENETEFQLMKGRELTKSNKEFRSQNKALKDEIAKLREQLENQLAETHNGSETF